ncbi:hypothetical protein HKCCE3408_03525 [Rhodobacterales bacterium HKCCE3408]|nr:hypothetical protein [Rhodobacterales bacterium HKCCE3408]
MATNVYATPIDDLNAWRSAAPDPETLPPHLVAFLQGGVFPTIGARGPDGRPMVATGVGTRVEAGQTVRVLVMRRPNPGLIEAIAAGSALAVTFSRARDHRSIQLKAASAKTTPVAPDDICEMARQTAILADELTEIGYTRAQADAMVSHDPDDLVSIAFRPDRIYTQTPGPGAGAELER